MSLPTQGTSVEHTLLVVSPGDLPPEIWPKFTAIRAAAAQMVDESEVYVIPTEQ
ncbi:MAG: hypothetical protein M3Q36_00340 [bacterium]|nr:hypothetical protein [bacterium]